MARSNSKYFASVISKLIAEKRKEKIAIDETFKAELREKILTGPLPVLEEVREPFFADFVRRWRYAFAIVPSALVVMIVAAQFLNMPVEVPSEQVTSTPVQTSQEETQEEVQTAVEETTDEAEETMEELQLPPERPALRTFPGALVLPPRTDDEVSRRPTVAPGGPVVLEREEAVSPPPTAPAHPNFSLDLFGLDVDLSMPEDDRDNTTTTHREVKTRGEDEDETAGSVEPVEEPEEDVFVREPATIQHVEGPEREPEIAKHIEQPVQKAREEDEQETAAPVNALEPLQMKSLSEEKDLIVGSIERPESVVAQAPSYAGKTNYHVDLTDAQKAVFESTVLPSLMKGGEASSVRVFDNNDGVVRVELLFGDGSILTRYYKYNSGRGSWDKVEYVQQYFFDNQLSYTTRFQY